MIVTKQVKDLELWQDNPRSIKKERYEELKRDIKANGFEGVLKLAADGKTVIGGNHRLRVLKDLGIAEVNCFVTKAKTDQEIFLRAMRDNEEFAYYEEEQLAELAFNLEIPAMELERYELHLSKPTPLSDLLTKYGPEPEEDTPPEVDESKTVSKPGEIYQLGRHRLMCGDSSNLEQVRQLLADTIIDLLLTDPPYGELRIFADKSQDKVGVDSPTAKAKSYAGNYRGEGNFKLEPILAILYELNIAKRVIWGGNFFDCLPIVNSWLCWDKTGGDRNMKNIFSDFELAWTNLSVPMRIFHYIWKGMVREGERIERTHPTEKPVSLSAWVLQEMTPKAKNILDLFGGSGSTLIACEQLDRTCYMMELDPKYTDLIRRRYWKKVNDGQEEGWQEGTPLVVT